MKLRARQFAFEFPRPALVMGVLNVTPDSFSDGGQYLDLTAATDHAQRMVQEGAEMIDVGGESTRPRSIPVAAEEELRRVIPVMEKLAGTLTVPISIDTRKPEVARAALEAGASFVNDIGANREDPQMWSIAAEFEAGYIAMHMQGSPETMQLDPAYQDVVAEVGQFFTDRLDRLVAAGVAREQVVLDVGIGFGKTLEHNLQLLGGLKCYAQHERPLAVGVSRKSFIGKLLDVDVLERLPGSLACACLAVESGVHIIRTHDVAPTVQAVRMTEAMLRCR